MSVPEPARAAAASQIHSNQDQVSAVPIERHRLRPDAWWPLCLTPLGVVWETWRSMGWALTWSWLAWIWAWAAVVTASGARFSRSQGRLAEEPAGEQDTP